VPKFGVPVLRCPAEDANAVSLLLRFCVMTTPIAWSMMLRVAIAACRFRFRGGLFGEPGRELQLPGRPGWRTVPVDVVGPERVGIREYRFNAPVGVGVAGDRYRQGGPDALADGVKPVAAPPVVRSQVDNEDDP
jgi:hypothetical protein